MDWVQQEDNRVDKYYFKYMCQKRRLKNIKPLFKYLISKDLYQLADVICLYNRFNLEFLTLNHNYKSIWSKLRISEDYGECRLLDCGFENNYKCYIVDVWCPTLVRYIQFMNDYCNPMGKVGWCNRALNLGWSNSEVEQGYLIYKQKCDNWFRLHFK